MQKKFNLEDIADVCGASLKKNVLSFGVDVAEIKTGLCLLRTDDKNLYIDGLYVLKMSRNTKELHQTIDKYIGEAIKIREQLEKDSKPEVKVRILTIEDCWFGKNVWTLKILAKFAVVVYLVFKKWATFAPNPIQPKTARCRVGFKKDAEGPSDIKKQIHAFLVDEMGVEIDDEDLADGFVLALAGLVEVEE